MCMVGWKLPVQYFPSWDVHVLQLSFSQNCNMIKISCYSDSQYLSPIRITLLGNINLNYFFRLIIYSVQYYTNAVFPQNYCGNSHSTLTSDFK